MYRFELLEARWSDISYAFSELNLEINYADNHPGFKEHIKARMEIYYLLLSCPHCQRVKDHHPGCKYE